MTASVAGAVRAAIAAAPAGTFIRNADVPGSRAGVNTALSRLAADGEVVRVRNGLYWKGVKSRFGSGIPGLLDAAIAAAGGDGAGPSGWSAAQALGLSTQVPAIPEVAVAGPVPSLRGVRFHKRNNLARRDLSVCEIALLEALRSYPASRRSAWMSSRSGSSRWRKRGRCGYSRSIRRFGGQDPVFVEKDFWGGVELLRSVVKRLELQPVNNVPCSASVDAVSRAVARDKLGDNRWSSRDNGRRGRGRGRRRP